MSFLASLFLSTLLAAHAAPASEPLDPPLRQARMHGTLYRTDADHPNDRVEVCAFDGKIPVYPAFQKGMRQQLGEVANCDTSIEGHPANVGVAGILTMPAADANPAFKKGLVSVFVQLTDGDHEVYMAQNATTGSDPEAKRLYLILNHPDYMDGAKQVPASQFWAVVYFEDENQ